MPLLIVLAFLVLGWFLVVPSVLHRAKRRGALRDPWSREPRRGSESEDPAP